MRSSRSQTSKLPSLHQFQPQKKTTPTHFCYINQIDNIYFKSGSVMTRSWDDCGFVSSNAVASTLHNEKVRSPINHALPPSYQHLKPRTTTFSRIMAIMMQRNLSLAYRRSKCFRGKCIPLSQRILVSEISHKFIPLII
jgi:hypothetical protein